MTLVHAKRAKELAEKYLSETHGGILNTASQKINESYAKGSFKASFHYGKEMNNASRQWLTNKLKEQGYKVTSTYSSQYNEPCYMFDVSWE